MPILWALLKSFWALLKSFYSFGNSGTPKARKAYSPGGRRRERRRAKHRLPALAGDFGAEFCMEEGGFILLGGVTIDTNNEDVASALWPPTWAHKQTSKSVNK